MRRFASAVAAVAAISLAAGASGALAVGLGLGAAASARVGAPRAPAPPSGVALETLAKPPVRSSIASQRIYFLLTDRYANGDASNDRGGRSGSRNATGFDPTDSGWFHGGDFAGLTDDCATTTRGLARIKNLGFTAVWITPPYGQKAVQGDSAAYHGYWIRDFAGVDPHLGTEQEFGAFVTCAHRLGLKVFLDVVVNHTADVVRLSSSAWVSPQERPYRDCRGRRFSPARYVFSKGFPCLKAANMPRFPSIPADERDAKRPAWLNNVTKYHNRGDVDFGSCSELCFEQGDFFGLDDLFTEQPAVVNGLAEVYADWIRRYKVDGFRIDTARHVNRAFFPLWVPKIRAAARNAGVDDFELFGEAFVRDSVELSAYVRKRGLPNVLDFPFQDAATRYAAGAVGPGGLATRLADDDYFQVRGVAHTPPTFLGNHDIGRAARAIADRAPGVSGDELLRRVLFGHDLLYLLRGAPVVYYGDEVGIIGRGGDKQARQDLFPTQVREWQTEARVGAPAIGVGSAFDVDHAIARRLKALAALREAHPALATGATIVRRSAGSIFALSRIDASTRREYLVVFNSTGQAGSVTLPTSTPSSTWTPLLGAEAGPVTSGANGSITVGVRPFSTVVLWANATLPASAPQRPVLRVGRDDLSNLWRLSAAAGAAPVSVSFAVRRAGGRAWQRVSADDSPPYRTFVDPRRYPKGKRVHAVAVTRALDGRTAISRVVTFVGRR